MYKASCLCQGVKITLTGKIEDIIHCHCSKCRKSSGTAYATNGFVNTDELIVEQGQELIADYEVKPGFYRHFCSRCGSPLYSSNKNNPHKRRLRLGILDSDISERPGCHIFADSKANWDNINGELPVYPEYDPKRQNKAAV